MHWTLMCCEGFRGQGRKVMLGYVNCVSRREPETIVHRTQTLLLQGGHFYFSLKLEASVEGVPRKHAKDSNSIPVPSTL